METSPSVNDHVIVALLAGAPSRVNGIGDSGTCTGSLPLPPRQHVYTISFTADGTKAVLGTSAGMIHVIGGPFVGEDAPRQSLCQGAGVLSLCSVSRDRFVVSDTVGRLLLWDLGCLDGPPRDLFSGPCVCALVGVGGGFIGHMADGGLLLHEPEEACRLIPSGCSGPPEPVALARGVRWPAANAVAFTAKGGVLLIHRLDPQSTTRIDAHRGETRAITMLGDTLLTFGELDGTVKGWHPGETVPAFQLRAPAGVVAAAVLDASARRLILVHANGAATIATLHEDGMELGGAFPDGGYRTVAGLSLDLLEQCRQRTRLQEITRIQMTLDARLNSGRIRDSEADLRRLDDLGASHMALAYRGQAAALTNDRIAEVGFRIKLAGLLPDAPASLDSLRRLAYLLESLCGYKDAQHVLERILRIKPDDTNTAAALERVTHVASLMDAGIGVLKTEEMAEFVSFVQCADALNRPFQCKCLIKELAPLYFGELEIPPAPFLGKIEHFREENGGDALPSARRQDLAMRQGSRELFREDSVVFPVDDASMSGIELSYGFRATSTGTTITPRVLLDMRSVSPADSAPGHNAACLHLLAGIEAGALPQSGLRHVHEVSRTVLGRAVNKLLAQCKRRVYS